MATYTVLSSRTIDELLQNYELGELFQCEIMDGGQTNSSSIVVTEKGKFVLSVCDNKSEEEIQLLTNTLDHLNRNNFPTSRLIKTREDGGYIFHEGKPVYIKAFIEGQVEENRTQEMYYQIGQGLATLHTVPVFEGLPPQFPYGLQRFSEVNGCEGEYPEWLKQKIEQLQPCQDKMLPKGLIHGDLFYDNILFHEGELTAILDFEEVCNYSLVFDVGMCIAGCCNEQERVDMKATASLVGGYQSVRKLEELERELLQLHIIYGAVATSFWRYRQFNILYPNVGKNDAHLEMVNLADQVDSISATLFQEKIFGKQE